jgi:hypothetical protein
MTNEQNPLMAKIKLPGRTFQLPSRAALYKQGEVNGTEGEVHVHPMSALAEISLKNPDQLFNGSAIKEVFAECIPEIKKPTELYGRDIDAIMLFLRLVTYGPDFEIKVKHDCEHAKNHDYMINIEKLISEIRYLDPTVAEEEFQTTLPNGQVVKVHPIKFEHMIKLYQLNAGKQEFTPDDIKKNVVFNLTNLIDSVDDTTKRVHIEEWVKTLTSPYQNQITETIEKTNNWGPNQTVKIKCKDCGEEIEVELPLNPISFFTE